MFKSRFVSSLFVCLTIIVVFIGCSDKGADKFTSVRLNVQKTARAETGGLTARPIIDPNTHPVVEVVVTVYAPDLAPIQYYFSAEDVLATNGALAMEVPTGEGRVFDVSVRELITPSSNVFPAIPYLMTTAIEDRTVDLTGVTVLLNIQMSVAPTVTISGVVSDTRTGIFAPLETCANPNVSFSFVEGQFSPMSVPVTLGVGATYTISGVPADASYEVAVGDSSAGGTATGAIDTASGNVTLDVDLFGAGPVAIFPDNVAVNPGQTVNFGAAFGAPPYTFVFTTNSSLGNIATGGNYTAGSTQGVVDIVEVHDACYDPLMPHTFAMASVGVNTMPECSDGVDNDSDGSTDFPSDTGCDDAGDFSERGAAVCDDGVDNDGDSLVDFPSDTDCADILGADEGSGVTACSDTLDNDGDTLSDLLDPGCVDALDTSELGTTACDDGLDGDGWADTDITDPGCAGPADIDEFNASVACDDNSDNDTWGDVDALDPGCASANDFSELGSNECDDGIDNDSWGDIDNLDVGCANASDLSENSATACDNGTDDDGWGEASDVLDPGCLSPGDVNETDASLMCDNGADNDGWGDSDHMDPGCTTANDADEWNVSFICDDGLDNDGWGDFDVGDPGCSTPADNEFDIAFECDDGIDNDGWSDIDQADPGCSTRTDAESGATQCDDGIDNDGWGDVDMADPGCPSALDDELDPAIMCDNGADNDGWGDTDATDPGCSSSLDTDEWNVSLICDDGLDNDGWGDFDRGDPGCLTPADDEYNLAIACDNGLDDDAWGDIDIADPGCLGKSDPDETDGAFVCDNGIDDDGWGDIDAADGGCMTSADDEFDPAIECDDGVTNDFWPDIDAADTGCTGATDVSEYDVMVECDDGMDNDAWGDIDGLDIGCSSPTDLNENDLAYGCDDGLDSDAWGDQDFADPGCSAPSDMFETDFALPCDDGLDQDAWGDIDVGDPGCPAPIDANEYDPLYGCDNGADDDGWSDLDIADPACLSRTDDEYGITPCDDGVDNDGWGDVDFYDLGCANPADTEYDPIKMCDDGIDNDGWGDIDIADPGCPTSGDDESTPGVGCDDGADLDGWGDPDYLDPGCNGSADLTETSNTVMCDNGLDDDNWGDSDPFDPGCSSATDIDEYAAGIQCDNGINDDYDPEIDWLDMSCTSASDPSELGTTQCDDGIDNDLDGQIDFTNDLQCAASLDDNESNWEELPLGSATAGGTISNNVGSSGSSVVEVDPITGYPVVAWNDNTSGNYEIYIKKWNGTSWVEYGAGSGSGGGISAGANTSLSPCLTLDASGNPYVAWTETVAGNDEIYFKYWNGVSWLTFGTSASGGGVSNNAGASSFCSIDLDASGNPAIAWQDNSSGNTEIYIRYWDGLGSWMEQGAGSASGVGMGGISFNAGISANPTLAFDPFFNLHVAWEDDTFGNREIYLKQWNGVMWVEVGMSATNGGVSTTAADSTNSDIAFDDTGNPILVWQEASGEIYLRNYNGVSTWVELAGSGSGGGVSNNAGLSYLPSIATDIGGNVYVTWLDSDSGNNEIYIKMWDLVSWLTMGGPTASAGGISNNPGNSYQPDVAAAGIGMPFVVWQDNSGGNFDIYFKLFAP